MNTYHEIRNYINKHNVSDIITRKDLILIIKSAMGCWNSGDRFTTVDKYRCWLTQAGYLKWIYSGHYEILKKIPLDLTSTKLEQEAYPHRFKNVKYD
jgi:hypothetical protein